jgi:hypothetical protein
MVVVRPSADVTSMVADACRGVVAMFSTLTSTP